MAKKFYIKETDSEIVLRVNANLTGSTVRVVARKTGLLASSDLPSVITNAAKGEITVNTSGMVVGTYEVEIEQNQGGKLAHYPNKGYDHIIVGADLDN